MPDLPRLTPAHVRTLTPQPAIDLPDPALFDLPERVLQFGTGVFLRGFADYFIDRANRAGLFGGRIVAVGSTGSGRTKQVNDQGGLYTLALQGIDQGAVVDERVVVASISRALSAQEAWGDVLACAANPDLEVILSNTTEVGLRLDETDRPDLSPPRSFPGKLTAFLHARAEAFAYDPGKGLVILPCELLTGNGDLLRGFVHTLARQWGLGERFLAWLDEANHFCNTLVDRIVPGTPAPAPRQAMWQALGYRDDLLTACETYSLWAIEGDDALRQRLGFATVDPRIITAPDITPYRQRKVRILNGTHTAMVPSSILCGRRTVREAVADPLTGRFIRQMMLDEIVPTLDVAGGEGFAHEVLDRFANPFVAHVLHNIMLQATMKMRVRVVPSILRYQAQTGRIPPALAFGFAAFLRLRRDDDPARFPPDDGAEFFRTLWRTLPDETPASIQTLVTTACQDEVHWGTDLTAVPGLVEAITGHLVEMLAHGPVAALQGCLDEG